MSKLKRLSTLKDKVAEVKCPVTDEEIKNRHHDYPLLSPIHFARRYGELFQPIELTLKENTHMIQFNACTNPYCKWFGLSQLQFHHCKNKPSRYKLTGSSKYESQRIACNPDPEKPSFGETTWDCTSDPISNWSAAEEIARLHTHDSIQNWEPEYVFHHEPCPHSSFTPSDNPKSFYRQGKSSSKSQRWQCKSCKKFTNVLPTRRVSSTYHQQRNDILPMFAKLLLNRVPVKRVCEILDIGSQTYYSKLEWLYRRCLEFLERHESQTFKNKTFDSLWMNTDKMVYFLNNLRKRGKGGIQYDDVEESKFPTHIVVSGDVESMYIFRADVAFDWDATLDAIEDDTLLYKDDHLNEYARKNKRLRFQICPQPPTKLDVETESQYIASHNNFVRRGKYIDGIHVNSTYTALAHYWLIKQMIDAQAVAIRIRRRCVYPGFVISCICR